MDSRLTSRRPLRFVGAWLAGLCALAVPCLGAPGLPEGWFFPNRTPGLKELEGKPPPDLQLEQWIGDEVTLEQARGKVVIIDFWATWCGPCMASIPSNVQIARKYKSAGLVIIGVHDAKSGWDKAADVVREKQINYPVALDRKGGLSARAFNLAFWPTYIILDRQGLVRGAGLNPKNLENAVQMLLAEPASGGGAGAARPWPPADWFYGALRRPGRLRNLEGKPAPKLTAAQWLGAALTPADSADRVLVVHFLATGNGLSMKQAQALAELERQMGPQGVVVIGVCAPDEDWNRVKELAGQGRLPSRLCLDTPLEKARSGGPDGSIAAAFGVRFHPCTIVVDRAGRVRSAGVRVERVRELAGKLLAESGKNAAAAAQGPNEPPPAVE